MTTLYNISNFTEVRVNGYANSINTTFKGLNSLRKLLKPYGVQSVEPLFYSHHFNPLLTINSTLC